MPTVTKWVVALLLLGCIPLAMAQPYTAKPLPAQAPVTGQVWQQGDEANERENILIILDASGSMMGNLNDQTNEAKISVAKRTILQVLNAVPPTTNIGLRVYGATTSSRIGACQDTQLVVPIGSQQRYRIASALMNIHPTGATPISYSIIRAVNEDFVNLPGKKTIILVSDGMETCGQDPCEVAVQLQKQNVDVKINVVGFGLSDIGTEQQLKCIALSTFGQFYRADTAAQLADQLGRSLNAQTEVQGRILLPARPAQPTSVTPTKAAPAKPTNAKPKLKETEYRL